MCAGVRWQFSRCEGDVLRGGAEELPAATCGVCENSARCAEGGCKASRGQTGLRAGRGAAEVSWADIRIQTQQRGGTPSAPAPLCLWGPQVASSVVMRYENIVLHCLGSRQSLVRSPPLLYLFWLLPAFLSPKPGS